MKTAIIYYSKHHGNTKQILDAIATKHDVTLIDALSIDDSSALDLNSYDRIGFASGIYYSKFHKSVLQFAKDHLPQGKQVFFLYTYGAEKEGYTKAIREAVSGKNTTILGEFGCFGFNTFGPFKLIGGIAKNHPDQTDFSNAIRFFEGLGK